MRLIDADELKEQISWSEVCRLSIKEIKKIIDEAPTVDTKKADYYHLDKMSDPECIVKIKEYTCGACHHLIFKDHRHREGLCNLYRLHRCFDDHCVHEEEMS